MLSKVQTVTMDWNSYVLQTNNNSKFVFFVPINWLPFYSNALVYSLSHSRTPEHYNHGSFIHQPYFLGQIISWYQWHFIGSTKKLAFNVYKYIYIHIYSLYIFMKYMLHPQPPHNKWTICVVLQSFYLNKCK